MLSPVQFFKCLSDDTRLRCVTLLHQEGKLCVCELTAALDLSQPKISRHLALLRQCGLLLDNRDGQWVYYRINPNLPEWAEPLLDNALSAMQSSETFKTAQDRLLKMEGRPNGLAGCR